MASRLKKFWEYQQARADTRELLVPLKTKALILPFIGKPKALEQVIFVTPEVIEPPELIEERTFILAADVKLPLPWAEAAVKLQAMTRPAIIPPNSWHNIQLACNQLYRDNFGLLKLIISCEWTIHDIYGCNLQTPMFRFDEMGLLLLLHQGDEVIRVNAERIKILKNSGSITCLKKRQVKPAEENLLFNLALTSN